MQKVRDAAEDVGQGEFDIRVLLAVLALLAVLVNNACSVGASSSETPRSPTATQQVATVTTTAVASPTVSATVTPLATSIVEPTSTVAATLTIEIQSPVPTREEVVNQGEAPNTKFPETGSLEALGATLTVYNCVGSTGAVYCPGVNMTASGTELVPGTAACDPSFKGRNFQIVGDLQGLIWTCLDTGNFAGNLFDLWFYDLADGLAYIKTLPNPYQVTFVD